MRTDSDDTANRVLTRTALEWGCLLAVRMNETEAFQRHMSQLKDYYTDFSASLPPSDLQNAMLGLNLLHLLMEDRLAEFHSEVTAEHELVSAVFYRHISSNNTSTLVAAARTDTSTEPGTRMYCIPDPH